MTTETQTFMPLADITGIRVTCRKCGVRFSIPFSDEERVEQFVSFFNCPSCKDVWFEGGRDKRLEIANFIKHLLGAQKTIPELSFKLVFEVTNHEESIPK
jgi:hypothetical protein